LAVIDNIRQTHYPPFMAVTLNISLTEEQKSWLNSRREAGGFSSASDVVRELIRQRQEQEQAKLRRQFAELDRADGSNGAEPASVLDLVRRVKKERRAA
jgi:antitoxin ParD1/3/4